MEKICVKIHPQISQSEAFLFLGLIWQNILQIVPEMYFNLQVLCYDLQVKSTIYVQINSQLNLQVQLQVS